MKFKSTLIILSTLLAVMILIVACADYTDKNNDVAANNKNTTTVQTTTDPITTTTPVTTTTPITTTSPATTTAPITTTVPITTTAPITTTVPITTTQPPVTTTTPITTTQPPVTEPVRPPKPTDPMDLDGDGVIKLIKDKGCPEDKLPSSAKSSVSDAELSKIVAFLNEKDARLFINTHDYEFFSPQTMDLAILLRNNIANRYSPTKDEYDKIIAELKAKYEGFEPMTDPLVLRMSDCKDLVKKYLGIDTINDDMMKTLSLVKYIDSIDAYYSEGGGVEGFDIIEDANAWKLTDGNILVIVEDLDGVISTVLLKPNGASYLIIQSISIEI